MTVGNVSHTIPQYQVPATPKAKQDDERTESIAVKQRESDTGKDVAVPTQAKGAVNIKA